MVRLHLPSGPLKLLCLGAHCDDIEIGCGGTLARWVRERQDLEIRWQVFTSNADRKSETLDCAARLLQPAAGRYQVSVLDFRDGFLPAAWPDVKDAFESLKREWKPDLVLTHYRDDLHQDHRLISELTWNTWRDHLILEYEIPKWDGDLGAPACFVPLEEQDVSSKISSLLSAYGSQRGKNWFTEDLFRSLMRIRGMECNAPSGFAEAFHVRKLVL
jgi:LmbE family N-acetylglucosaminyl deacetylase